MNTILTILYFILFICNYEMYGDENKKRSNLSSKSFYCKILAPKIFTISDTNFSYIGDNGNIINNLYAEFDILYITDTVIYKLPTINALFMDMDSIDIVEETSKFESFKILSKNSKFITYKRDSTTTGTIIIDVKNRSILMENTEFVVKKNVRVESVDQFKSWVDDFVHKRKSSKGLNIDNLCPADE